VRGTPVLIFVPVVATPAAAEIAAV